MKQKLFFLVVVLFLVIAAKAQEHFYYYKGEKVFLELDLKRVSMNTNQPTIDYKRDQVTFSNISQDYTRNSLVEDSGNMLTSTETYYYEINLADDLSVSDYLKLVEDSKRQKSVLNAFVTFKTAEGGVLGLSNNFYVKLKKAEDVELLKKQAASLGLKVLGYNEYMPLWYVINVSPNSDKNPLELANDFFESELFESAEPAFIYHNLQLSNDPFFHNQWGLKNTGQYGGIPGMDTRAEQAWNITKGARTKVAIFDHGFEMNHPDLQVNVHGVGYDATTATSPAQVRGSHGTPCAGIVGAVQNNAIGISGIAPEASLISISINLMFSDTPLMLANGFSWAWRNGVDVISNSWGGYAPSHMITDAIYDALTKGRDGKGCIVVFAAGNENNTNVRYPGSYFSEILVVGAMSPCGQRKSPTSCDNEQWGSCYGSKLDVVAPGVKIVTTDRQGRAGYDPTDYVHNFNGTSSACPFVAGVAALVLAVNPDLTGQEVRDLIERTARPVRTDLYNYSTYRDRPNGEWSSEMGYGLIDAYAAVRSAQETLNLDLHIRNSILDVGAEPDLATGPVIYNSPDIWVRNQPDGQEEHQNPQYHNQQANYVYVRVKNIGTKASTVNDSIKLHWAKASTSLMWPDYWDGSITHNGIPMGGIIGTQAIPILQPGQEILVSFPWRVPNPRDYHDINPEPWHFCLLSRIISTEDPMTFNEVFSLADNVRNNNNIAWKNLTVVNIQPNQALGGVVRITNPFETTTAFDLEIFPEGEIPNAMALNEVEIQLILSDNLYQAWLHNGRSGQGVSVVRNHPNTIKIRTNQARLENLVLPPHYSGTANLKFNFLAETARNSEQYQYHVIQRKTIDQRFIGGEAYLVKKTQRVPFRADAGTDRTVSLGERFTLSAKDIGEPATYNWYDAEQNLIDSGRELSLIANSQQQYTLEVIADADGYKDYAAIAVHFKHNVLKEVFPNPATTSLQVNYEINVGSEAHLKLIPFYGVSGEERLYPIDVHRNHKVIDISGQLRGLYKLALYCNGELVEMRNLLID
ncbi:S8 family serine peptidase [Flavobacterium sp. NKUCC04_CG]|uniref:S8 family peptidase n=1 Tax=Flavobacterium sp. NKUCC04_CG TaxID=2842121 RepID=UPI001C5BAF07|nr:S8 family serine peptidase [Flavobacterium sp. NKUCC04_CG]MBW3520035.1 S8 family serine peptidase [Flavobacterium sp. NKUCC04_CG]